MANWSLGRHCCSCSLASLNPPGLFRYNAVVEDVGRSGTFIVAFDGYGTQEEVGKDAIQLRVAEDDAGYKGGERCCL